MGNEVKQFRLLPITDPRLCKECGREHTPDQPHDKQRLHYQYHFYFANGRWPTWKDAMAHCDEETQTAWTVMLRDRGVEVG
jgi:hypothetical protein